MRWWLAVMVSTGCTRTSETGDDDDDDDDATTTREPRPDCEDTSLSPQAPERPSFVDDASGTRTYLYGDELPESLILAFHGSGGEAENLSQIHPFRLWNTFGAVGFGVVGPESVDRVSKTWDLRNDPSNVDYQNILAVLDHYVAAGTIREDTPLVLWGFSNGAAFTETFARLAVEDGLPVEAALVFSGAWSSAPVPAFFTTPEHDDIVSNVRSAVDELQSQGADVALTVTREHPWDRREMLLNPAYDEDESNAVFDELVLGRYIDADGVRLGDVDQVDGLMVTYERNSALPGPERVTPLLRVAWATHRPPSETACEMRDFVLDRR